MGLKVKKQRGKSWSLRTMDDRYIPQNQWPAGLQPDLPIEQAREIVQSLNNSQRITEEEAKRRAALSRVTLHETKGSAWLPEDIVAHFERLFLQPRINTKGFAKLKSTWKLVQKLILELNLDPSDWALEPFPIYEWFRRNPHSLDYSKRILRMLNAYGYVYCRKRGTSFLPVSAIPEQVRADMEDAFGNRKRSGYLLPEHLKDLRKKLAPKEFAWVLVAFAFGLRPEETDQLRQPDSSTWAIEKEGKVLAVYQPKLRRVTRDRRWKRIPVVTHLQKQAIQLLRDPHLARPGRRRVERAFPEGVSLYGCRHGFCRHMEELGYSMDKISKWLGHRSIKTTEKYYRDHGLLAEADEEGEAA